MGDNIYPNQRTSRAEKRKKDFFEPLVNYVSSKGSTNMAFARSLYDAVNGTLNQKDYHKVLNPYNAVDPKFLRFPAELRNYDIMKEIVRRYLGEYMKQYSEFQVISSDPSIIDRFNKKLGEEIANYATMAYNNALISQGSVQGQQQELPDFETFYEDFKKNYIDENTIQGQHALNSIIDHTNSIEKYLKAFYDFIVIGETFSYRDIRNGEIYKEIVSPMDMIVVSNGEAYVEDHDLCGRRFKVSIPSIISKYNDIIPDNVIQSIKDLYDKKGYGSGGLQIPMQVFDSYYGDAFDRQAGSATSTSVTIQSSNKYVTFGGNDLMVDGVHIVFKTEVPVYYVTRVDYNSGMTSEVIIEEDSYTLNPMLGDINVEKDWWNETWEVYRFGAEAEGIYSIPRPIAYQRRPLNNLKDCKLNYNGIIELIPDTGFNFSIPVALLPYQITRNIFFYAREKIIAKNKDKFILMPKSLLGDKNEKTIHTLEAAGILRYDDTEDDNGVKAAHIRVLDASLGDYVVKITDIIDRLKADAWSTVDMNDQRYGDIAISAGKATTQEAIVRSSMGSVVLFGVFDNFIQKEYTADLDYSKVTLSDSKLLTYRDVSGSIHNVSFDPNIHILADYRIFVKNGFFEREEKQKLQDVALAAAQNNNFGLAVSAITEKSVTSLSKAILDYENHTRELQQQIETKKEELQLQASQLAEATAQKDRESNEYIANLKEQGETERKILEIQAQLVNISNVEDGISSNNEYLNDLKVMLDEMKLKNDMIKHKDNLKQKYAQMANDKAIAKMNKN